MRAHVIENGIVVNTVEVETLDALPNLVEATGGSVGWSYSNGVFTVPAPIPKTREELKAERQAAVDVLKVTVSTGKVFDGNDEAQMNMLLALQVASIANLTETLWTLADNTRVMVTLAEMKEAIVLAGLAKSDLWSAM